MQWRCTGYEKIGCVAVSFAGHQNAVEMYWIEKA